MRGVFRHPPPLDRRGRVAVVLGNFFLHIHPTATPKHALRLGFTWCMGGITAFLFLVETLTGLLLMFYYRPTVQWAYRDILDLRDAVPLGFLRELHRWGAHAMVVAVLLHMLRVFLTGSYKPPREFNWVIGVLLLAMTLLLSFTGYLLPWDQLSLLGGHRGVEHGRRDSAGRRRWAGPSTPFPRRGGMPRSEAVPPGRAVRGRRDAPPLLRPPLHRHPAAGRRFHGRPFWRVRKDGISGPL